MNEFICIICKKDQHGIFGRDRGLFINNHFLDNFPDEMVICKECCIIYISPVIRGELSLPSIIKLISSLMKGIKKS